MGKDFLKLPKIELHCHLDGSLPLSFLEEESKIEDRNELIKQTMVSGTQKNNLTEYLRHFDVPIKCLQTEEQIKKGANAFVHLLESDHVIYSEVRFSPALLTNETMSSKKVLEAVLEGLNQGSKETGVFTNVLICAMRGQDETINEEEIRLAREYLGQGVCGVDLAGDESHYPAYLYRELFKVANQLELPFTIHAGECQSRENIREVIDMGARRIGHGIAMRGDLELQKYCRDRNVGIELCPISNYQTGALEQNEVYPFWEFMQNGLCVTVNTDNRTVSDTTLEKEYLFLNEKGKFTRNEWYIVTQNAISCSFATEEIKECLLQKLAIL